MRKRLLKVDPRTAGQAELDFDRAYYLSLTTAERFRLVVDRSILLLRLAERNAANPRTPAIAKRR